MQTKEAVAAFGTKKRLAEVLGLQYQSIKNWGAQVPENRVKHVELAIRALRAGILD